MMLLMVPLILDDMTIAPHLNLIYVFFYTHDTDTQNYQNVILDHSVSF